MRNRGVLIGGLGLAMLPLLWGCSSSGGFVLALDDAGQPIPPTADLQRPLPRPDLRSPLNDQLALSAPTPFAVSKLPFMLHIADVNRDGKLDAVVSGGTLELLLGKGDGRFESVRLIEAVGGNGVATADFNRDGKLDVAHGSGMNLRLYLGRGDGTFAMGTSLPIDTNAVSLAAADLNHDERPDLVIGDYGSGASYVYLLPGRGDGTFGPIGKLPSGLNPHSLRALDLNNDGHSDLVTADYGGSSASVFVGRGDGSFASPLTVPAGANPTVVEVADLNLDAIPDLVLNSFSRPELTLHLGRGDGTFQPAQTLSVPSERNTYGLAVGDLNRDGVADLAVCSANNGSQVSVLLGKGDGSFRPPITLPVGTDTFFLGIADWNGDGGLDLAVTNAGSPTALNVLLNRSAAP